jgi:hypothetical protein
VKRETVKQENSRRQCNGFSRVGWPRVEADLTALKIRAISNMLSGSMMVL